ncbi:MAG: hypothetical protein PUK77_01340 [bacterium]|nr:hypothetical protein [bacterium]
MSSSTTGMKNDNTSRLSLIFTVLLCSSPLLTGKDAKLLDDGILELDGWRGTVTTYSKEWKTLTPAASPMLFHAAQPPAKHSAETQELRYRLELPNGGRGNLVLSLKNGSDLQGTVNLEHGTLTRYFCLSSPLSILQYAGTRFEVDGKQHTFPAEYKEETIFDGIVRQFRFPTKSGEVLLKGKFYLRIQDGRKWQGATYGMRIGFLPYQGVEKIRDAKLDFRIRYGKSGEFGAKLGSIDRPPYVAKAGKDWKAFTYRRDVLPGSALDFSARLDAPAGKYGPVIAGPDGQFVFRGRAFFLSGRTAGTEPQTADTPGLRSRRRSPRHRKRQETCRTQFSGGEQR